MHFPGRRERSGGDLPHQEDRSEKSLEVSSVHQIDSSMETRKPAAAHVSVVEKGNLTNPYAKLFGSRPEEREKRPGITPTLTEAQFDGMLHLQAHDRGSVSIASVDYKGYVLLEGKKRYIDMVRAQGLGNADGRRSPGEVILASYRKDGLSPSSPEEVEHYGLLVTFPGPAEEGGEEDGALFSERLNEFSLDNIHPKQNLRAREEAKALFDAVAQYVDDGLDEGHVKQFIGELKDMLKRRVHHPEPTQHILPLVKLLKESRTAANRKLEVNTQEQIADIRRNIQARDAKPRAPEESGNDVALAIVSNQIMTAEKELRERYGVEPGAAAADGDAVPLSEAVLTVEADIRKRFGIDADAIGKSPEVAAKLEALRKLREEKRQIEDLIDGKR